jgi:hypothetical protein
VQIQRLVADIQVVLSSRQSWQIRHIQRVASSAAYGLAKAAVKQSIDRVWIEEIPEGIRDIVVLEQYALVL